ncbi:hypothetical protein BDZ97DRAFT_1929207 [Flammula alnicola]|nr:hypothetical protein BDZ97DRAFT_1929207 [Flammula alnicola]
MPASHEGSSALFCVISKLAMEPDDASEAGRQEEEETDEYVDTVGTDLTPPQHEQQENETKTSLEVILSPVAYPSLSFDQTKPTPSSIRQHAPVAAAVPSPPSTTWTVLAHAVTCQLHNDEQNNANNRTAGRIWGNKSSRSRPCPPSPSLTNVSMHSTDEETASG